MKEHNFKPKEPQSRLPVRMDDRSFIISLRFLLFLACGLILAVGIGWRIYKVDRSGITHDETLTALHYSGSPHTALTRYDLANNHLINSLCIYYTGRLFHNYEHYIRIPALCMGILYVLSAAYIAFKTIRSRLILAAALALLVFHGFVLDYCISARGYAFALGGIYLELAFLIRLGEKKIAFKYWWFPALVISVLNFIVFGSMLSSILMLAAINLVFILFYAPRIFKEQAGPLKAILVNGISIPLLSGVLSYLLYRGVLSQISHTLETDPSKGAPFFRYMYELLILRIFHLHNPLESALLTLFIALAGLKLLMFVSQQLRISHRRWTNPRSDFADPGILLYWITGVTVSVLFVYNVILKKPLAYPRNQVFFLPLVFLITAILLDRMTGQLKRPLFKIPVTAAVVFLLGGITWINFPRTQYAIGMQSISGPLLRQLKQIDPGRIWKIGIHRNITANTMATAFSYYKQYGYKFEITPAQFDVFLCRTADCPNGAALLDKDFYDQFGGRIVITPPFPTDKVQINCKIKK